MRQNYYYYRVEIDWIVRKISGNPSLFGVSKIFIFDCCCGRKVSLKKIFTNGYLKGISQVDGGISPPWAYGAGAVDTLPTTADVLISRATPHGKCRVL